jgi:TolA-binding protein
MSYKVTKVTKVTRDRRGRSGEKQALVTLVTCLTLVTLCACSSQKQTPQQRYHAAQELFHQTTKLYHLPSAEAQGSAREKLLSQAAAGYSALVKEYPDQSFWAAQALRSLGNVRIAQEQTSDAIKIYAEVAAKYPQQEWEVLQAWKSAADALWENGRRNESKLFYQKIVERFDVADAQPIVKTIVCGSKTRL